MASGGLRLGVLVSGRGSNLEAVLDAVRDGRLVGIQPALVIGNRPAARALRVAASHGVPVQVLRRADFGGSNGRDAAIGHALRGAAVQLALLAGYDQVLSPEYFAAFGGRTINIHPSLLPRHGGRGMVGDVVHSAVLAAGEAVTGVTIHEVIPALDAGPILAQATVPVHLGDDPATLARRVLGEEHRLLVATLGRLAEGGWADGPSVRMTGASVVPPGAGVPHGTASPHA